MIPLQQCDSGSAFLSVWGSVELLGFLCGTIWLFVRRSLPIRKAFPGKVVILLNCLDICCVARRGVSLMSEPPSSLDSSFETEKRVFVCNDEEY